MGKWGRVILAAVATVALIVLVVTMAKPTGAPNTIPSEPVKAEGARQEEMAQGLTIEIRDPQTRALEGFIESERITRAEGEPADLSKPRITLTGDSRRKTVITADRGVVRLESGERMQGGVLTGNVVLEVIPVEGDTMTLRCEELHYTHATQQVDIPGRVRIASQGGKYVIDGLGLRGDGVLGNAVLKQDVKVTIPTGVGPLWSRPEGPGSAGPIKEPLVVTCSGELEFQGEKNQAVFNRDVRAVQGDTQSTADRMVVLFEESEGSGSSGKTGQAGDTEVRKILLVGEGAERVHVQGPGREAWGEEMVYDPTVGVATLNGQRVRVHYGTGEETTRLEGKQVLFGEGFNLQGMEVLAPELSPQGSKVLLVGEPARMTRSTSNDVKGEVVSGERILYDPEVRVVVVSGGEKARALLLMSDATMVGRSAVLVEETTQRPAQVRCGGPGRVEIRKPAEPGALTPAVPTTVDFGQDMKYLPRTGEAWFSGEVHLIDGTTELRCRELKARTVTEGTRVRMEGIVARGHVSAVDGNQRFAGEELTYGLGGQGETHLVSAGPQDLAEVRWGENFLRSPDILYQGMGASGKDQGKARLTGKGQGYLYLQTQSNDPEPGTQTASPRVERTEVWFTEGVLFEEERNEAVFTGNVRSLRDAIETSCRKMTVKFMPQEKAETDAAMSRTVGRVTCEGEVKVKEVREGSGASGLRAACERMVWERVTNETVLEGKSREFPARVEQGGSVLEAPTIRTLVRDGGIERAATEGGGKLTVRRPEGAAGTEAQPDVTDIMVTWNGPGRMQPESEDRRQLAATFNGDAVARSGRDELQGYALTVYLSPGKEDDPGGGPGLSVSRLIATGNVKARLYDQREQEYRYGRGGRLTWERQAGRIMLAGPEAVAWSGSSEWRGDEVTLTRGAGGGLHISSQQTEVVIFADERRARTSTDPGEADKWVPLD